MHESELVFFLSFLLLIFLLLFIDLGVFNKHDKVMSNRAALGWTSLWVLISLGCYAFLYFFGHLLHSIDNEEELRAVILRYGQDIKFIPGDFEHSIAHYRSIISLEYLSGYLLEYSLSADNIFVMILIFAAFKVEKRFYHRVLFWGILGAVLFRLIFIFLGAFLIAKFAWILYVFAVFLVYTGINMIISRNKEDELDTQHHPVVRFASRFFRVHKHFVGNQFFVKIEHKRYITPLFLVLLIIEFSDVLFAVDSIPAIFAVTRDPYIVFFSNIFAILGLRSMFFLLLNVMDKLRFFKIGLALLLVFIGAKMLLDHWLHSIGFTPVYSLIAILLILSVSIVASLLFPEKGKTTE